MSMGMNNNNTTNRSTPFIGADIQHAASSPPYVPPGTSCWFPRQQDVHKWAWHLMHPDTAQERGAWCVLDTETTGLEDDDEIVELAIIDGLTGETFYLNHIKPTAAPISPAAMAVHGITPELLVGRNTLLLEWPVIYDVLSKYGRVVTYNAPFDRRMLLQSARAAGLSLFVGIEATERAALSHSPAKFVLKQDWICAMNMYAHGFGVARKFSHSRGWVRLEEACHAQGVQLPAEKQGWHNAETDARATYDLIATLAQRHQADLDGQAGVVAVEEKLEVEGE